MATIAQMKATLRSKNSWLLNALPKTSDKNPHSPVDGIVLILVENRKEYFRAINTYIRTIPMKAYIIFLHHKTGVEINKAKNKTTGPIEELSKLALSIDAA